MCLPAIGEFRGTAGLHGFTKPAHEPLLACAGGSPYAVVGMLDTIRAIQPQVSTVAMGNCSSTATVLLVGLQSSPICWLINRLTVMP
jgi:Clp protease